MKRKRSSGVIHSIEERLEAGRHLRKKCPRSTHGKVVLGQGDKRDPVALIEASNEDRLEHLIPIRHGRMVQSAFAFFRGTAAVQAHDLAGTPSSGIIVQACGDCHLMNFGGFATPERNLAFDINDFDETLPAPFEWDLKRLAASFVVAARWREFHGDNSKQIAMRVVAAYRESMRKRADSDVLDAWYARITMQDLREIAGDDAMVKARVKLGIAEARKQTHEHVFHKLTAPSHGLPRIVDQPPLLYHAAKRKLGDTTVADFLKRYRESLPRDRQLLFDRFTMIDAAIKVVGVGSVGTRCYVALMMAAPNDPLFLQIKEARASVLEPYVGGPRVAHNGERVVVGQRVMQSASDIFLGWSRGPAGRDFYVRQLRDMKVAANVEAQTPRLMRAYATFCGITLARAHAKAGDAAMIAGYLGNSEQFDEAIADYAVGYADQVERDYEALVKAVRSGRIKTDTMGSQLETALR